MEKSNRGFASLSPERRKELARQGGKTVAKNREYMSMIGKKGGQNVAKNREHMAAIGRKGGKNTQSKRKDTMFSVPTDVSEVIF